MKHFILGAVVVVILVSLHAWGVWIGFDYGWERGFYEGWDAHAQYEEFGLDDFGFDDGADDSRVY